MVLDSADAQSTRAKLWDHRGLHTDFKAGTEKVVETEREICSRKQARTDGPCQGNCPSKVILEALDTLSRQCTTPAQKSYKCEAPATASYCNVQSKKPELPNILSTEAFQCVQEEAHGMEDYAKAFGFNVLYWFLFELVYSMLCLSSCSCPRFVTGMSVLCLQPLKAQDGVDKCGDTQPVGQEARARTSNTLLQCPCSLPDTSSRAVWIIKAALGKTAKQVEFVFDVFRLQAWLRLGAIMLPCPYATSPQRAEDPSGSPPSQSLSFSTTLRPWNSTLDYAGFLFVVVLF